MLISVSKEVIIKALREETRLASGTWISPRSGGTLSGCTVCAVGAVLCHILGPDATPDRVYEASGTAVETRIGFRLDGVGITNEDKLFRQAQDYLDEGVNPMAVLSFVFESEVTRDDPVSDRLYRCLYLVSEMFPKNIDIDIGEALPNADYISN